MEALTHITANEIIGAILGIVFIWSLRYSKEKDKFDDADQKFSMKRWFHQWFTKRNDNILIHVLFTFVALVLGVDNLQAWLGDSMSIPDGVDETGAAFIIGFTGTYIVELLKKPL